MADAFRLLVVMTHPVQYLAPWFRFIARDVREIDLNVLYVSEPSSRQQGVGFGAAFFWDVPLRDGYCSKVFRPATPDDRFESDSFMGLDAPGIGTAIAQSRPDAVLINGWHSVSLVRAILACRKLRVPLLYRGDSHLGGRGRRMRDIVWRLRTRWLLSHFDRYLCVGVRAREYLASFDISNGRVFDSPHAVDNDFFVSLASRFQAGEARVEARREWRLSPDDDVVAFVGKLVAHKHPLDLIAAVSRLSGVKLLFVGDGSLARVCRRTAAELGVDARFIGFLNQSELGKAYALADCLALPGDWETWGLVVNEAMASGLPAVVSDRIGCAPDLVVRGRTGAVFPFGDISALSRLLEDTLVARRRGQLPLEVCRERALEYSFAVATEGLLSACHSLR